MPLSLPKRDASAKTFFSSLSCFPAFLIVISLSCFLSMAEVHLLYDQEGAAVDAWNRLLIKRGTPNGVGPEEMLIASRAGGGLGASRFLSSVRL